MVGVSDISDRVEVLLVLADKRLGGLVRGCCVWRSRLDGVLGACRPLVSCSVHDSR
jgi:hypothetical protein